MDSRSIRGIAAMARVTGALGLLVLTATASQAGPIDVLAYYRLGNADPGAVIGNTANATTVDSSGNGHTLTRNGNPAYVAGSPYDPAGIAASFDGSDYFIGSSVAAGTDNFGIEAWVRPTASNPGSTVVYNGKTDTTGFGLYQIGDQFGLLYGGNVLQLATTPVALGEWVHLALVRDSGMTSFYVNSILAFSSFDGPNPVFGSMIIGANHVGTENFIGDISEVRVFTFRPGNFSTGDLLHPVPEPATLTLFGLGVIGVMVFRRRRSSSAVRSAAY